MTIEDFLYYCTDAGMLKIEVYDLETDTVVYSGYADELPSDLEYEEISSWDAPYKDGQITVNIH